MPQASCFTPTSYKRNQWFNENPIKTAHLTYFPTSFSARKPIMNGTRLNKHWDEENLTQNSVFISSRCIISGSIQYMSQILTEMLLSINRIRRNLFSVFKNWLLGKTSYKFNTKQKYINDMRGMKKQHIKEMTEQTWLRNCGVTSWER